MNIVESFTYVKTYDKTILFNNGHFPVTTLPGLMTNNMSATSGGGSTSSSTPTTQTPGLVTSAAPWGASRALGGTQPQRNFAQIISEEKAKQNILQITLKKIISKNEDGTEAKPVNLTFDDIGESKFFENLNGILRQPNLTQLNSTK